MARKPAKPPKVIYQAKTWAEMTDVERENAQQRLDAVFDYLIKLTLENLENKN